MVPKDSYYYCGLVSIPTLPSDADAPWGQTTVPQCGPHEANHSELWDYFGCTKRGTLNSPGLSKRIPFGHAMQGGWPRQSLCNSCNRVMDRICRWRCCRSCSRFFSPKSCDYIARVHPPCCIFSHSELMFLVRVWPEFYVCWLVGRWWLWSEQKANGQ